MKKEYRLVKTSARINTDLTDYKKIIEAAYAKINPDLEVSVHNRSYEVAGDLTRRQAIIAGTIIAKSSLGIHSVKYPINSKKPSTVQLFRGKKIFSIQTVQLLPCYHR